MPKTPPTELRTLEALRRIMADLRDPEGGCPWDLQQTYQSIVPYTIEEAYEVADAAHRGDLDDLKEELGDLLLQVIYLTQIAAEEKAFTLEDVIEEISTKMIRRHPHVYGGETRDRAGQVSAWEQHKAEERAAKRLRKDGDETPASLLDDVPANFPALTRALKLQKRAARVGFDWKRPDQVLDKLQEELEELREAVAERETVSEPETGPDAVTDEFGDVLFVLVNYARHLKVDPEEALSGTNRKFISRFKKIEEHVQERGRTLEQASLEEMEAAWVAAKAEERNR